MNPAASSNDTERNWSDLFDFLEPPEADENEGRTRYVESREYRAYAKYEEVFCKLTAFFDNRGCNDAEGRAAETIRRVAEHCREVELQPGVRPLGYFYGVARNVLKEVYKQWEREAKMLREHQLMPTPAPAHEKEARDACLEECMEKRLADDERELIIDYYRGQRAGKIDNRRQLAAARNKDLNALRIETHRIRKRLRPCITDCLDRVSATAVFA